MRILSNLVVCFWVLIFNEIGFFVFFNEFIVFLNMVIVGKWLIVLKMILLLNYFGKKEIFFLV